MSFFDTRCPSQAVERALACQAVGKFSRASSAGGRLNLRSSIEQPDRVGRRGLFEPREDFSRLLTHTIRGCIRGSIRGSLSVALALAYPAVGKFSRASSAGGRLNLRSSIEQPDRVGRRGLSEPREDFSRLLTYAIRGCIGVCIRGCIGVCIRGFTRGCIRGSMTYFTASTAFNHTARICKPFA